MFWLYIIIYISIVILCAVLFTIIYIIKKRKIKKKALCLFICLIYTFSGVRFIWEKFIPPFDKKEKKRKPTTIWFWLIGIYIAFFGFASQNYENKVDIIENRANAIITQLATPVYTEALSRIPFVQKMRCPHKPDFKNPYSVYCSLFTSDTLYPEIIDHLKEIVETWKGSLENVNFAGADLRGYRLQGANFKGAILIGAKLNDIDLSGAILNYARLDSATIIRANLEKANLQGAKLKYADLSYASLLSANLRNCDLSKTKLINANLQGDLIWSSNLDDANLYKANLSGVNLYEATLINTNLKNTNLSNSDDRRAIFTDANFDGAILDGAYLWEADLSQAKNLTVNQLLKVKSLYETKLSSDLKIQIEEKKPELFEVTEK